MGLLNVHGRARCPSRGWYAKEPHDDKGERAVGFMVSTTTGTGGGGGKGAEEQNFPGLTGLSGGQTPFTCLIARVQVWC